MGPDVQREAVTRRARGRAAEASHFRSKSTLRRATANLRHQGRQQTRCHSGRCLGELHRRNAIRAGAVVSVVAGAARLFDNHQRDTSSRAFRDRWPAAPNANLHRRKTTSFSNARRRSADPLRGTQDA